MKNKRIKLQLLACVEFVSLLSYSAITIEAKKSFSDYKETEIAVESEECIQTTNESNEFYTSTMREMLETERIKTEEEERLRLEEEERQRKINEEKKKTEQSVPTYSSSSGLTKSSGVNWHNGWKETYYSSRVLYHYMTPQWTVGSDGVYRDSDGYVIVASSSEPYGTITDTSFGMGKVYDTGCDLGVHDIYVNW